jgi:hypothetical protein
LDFFIDVLETPFTIKKIIRQNDIAVIEREIITAASIFLLAKKIVKTIVIP